MLTCAITQLEVEEKERALEAALQKERDLEQAYNEIRWGANV